MEQLPRKSPAYSVCAVVVTYHPDSSALHNLTRVGAQVPDLVVVDNGSTASELQSLRHASQNNGFHLIENHRNLGIAEALNQGVIWARANGLDWVILFDQDSGITDGFVEKLFAAWETHPQRERVASIHPKYIDPDSGDESLVRRAHDGGPIVSLTSGALIPTWIFDQIGGFASEYFIDCVDYEFCLRIRAAGYLIIDSRDAVLLHAAGNSGEYHRWLGFDFRPTNHSAARRYYISRNRVALYRTYFRVFPGWSLRFLGEYFRETVKCFLGEQNRVRKLRSFTLGTWDGLCGRMGKRKMENESL